MMIQTFTMGTSETCPCFDFIIILRLLTHYGLVRQKWSETFRSFFVCGKEQESLKKYVITVQKKFTFLRGFDRKNTFFEISKNLTGKACFQMTLIARKSWANSFSKIKTDDNRARFSRNQQNSEKFDSETSKLYPVNLSEKRRDTVGVHQRAADSWQRL